jgi:hypothetical protein
MARLVRATCVVNNKEGRSRLAAPFSAFPMVMGGPDKPGHDDMRVGGV